MTRYGWLVLVLGALLPTQVQAEWPNLNPFASSGPMTSSGESWYPGKYVSSGWKSMTNSVSNASAKASNWSIMPKPTQPTFRSEPSTMGKMWNGTKEAMYDTADFLNPWYNRPKYPGPFAPTGNSNPLNGGRTPVQKTIADGETPWWYPYPVEKEQKPKTVQDWLKLPRVEP
jgi:hypothetical protein